MRVYLVDNGSYRVEAYRNLERLAQALAARTGAEVVPAPLLHSDQIAEEALGGGRVRLFEERLREDATRGEREAVVLPLFFGPSGAVVSYLPRRIEAVREAFPALRVALGRWLFDACESAGSCLLTAILGERVRETGVREGPVVLVDHGSPRVEVTRVRDALAGRLAQMLGRRVVGASMERRESAAYDFNEPLLERALRQPGLSSGDVVVAQLFLSPGRHAGEGGDIAEICVAAERAQPGLRTHRTELVGTHPQLVELLAKRLQEVREGARLRV